MPISDRFLEAAKKQKRKIAIGIMRPIPETIVSLKRASEYANLVVVGAKVDGFENIVEEDQDKASEIIIGLLKDKKVDGIVRGQVKDSYTLKYFFKAFGREELQSNRKIFPGILKKDDIEFFVSTCSIYQGLTFEDKKFEVDRIIAYMRSLDIEPKVAIMSSLRPTSQRGKYPVLDEVAKLNTELATALTHEGVDAKEYYFEYETAVWEGRNLTVPATGLVGNAWVKALLYLGGWQLICCPYLDLGVVYEDGSRNEKDFYWHIVHAVAMANGSV